METVRDEDQPGQLRSDTGPFAIVPRWLVGAKVSDRAVRVYALLADMANRDTNACWPSRAYVAKAIGCSAKSVDRALAELRDAGAIEQRQRFTDGGDQTSNLYVVRLVPPSSPVTTPLDTGVPTPLDSGDYPPWTRVSHEQEPSEQEPSLTHICASDVALLAEFEEWYSVYPRKKARGAAVKAFVKAREKVSLAELVEGAVRYADSVEFTPPEYVAHPSTWLNQERWTDEDEEAW